MNFTTLFNNYLSEINISNILEMQVLKNSNTVPVDLTHLQSVDPGLYADLINNFHIRKKVANELVNLHKTSNALYECIYYNNPLVHALNDLKSERLQKLTTFSATVTRTSAVYPSPSIASYTCCECQCKIQVEVKEKVKLPNHCINSLCKNRVRFVLNSESLFTDQQKINVQDKNKNFTVYLRDEQVEKVKPGDKIRITGELSVLMIDGENISIPLVEGEKFNVKENGFSYIFIVNGIEMEVSKREGCNKDGRFIRINEDVNNMTNTTLPVQIYKMTQVDNLYDKLADSLFPNIHGHSSIKKSILLMLVQGNMKKGLRGDINILLVGDPGTAKSQFLKRTQYITGGIYTSGKSSTRAGLTACVVRDSEQDYTIEAGALMLADRNICCIDEFDKMDYKDRVSIHEAMEQQTITINKAGINCTLNARCSVFAAANPRGGKYDQQRNLKSNIALSEAIFSRFDLYFVLIDNVNDEGDKMIAEKILSNHEEWLTGDSEDEDTENKLDDCSFNDLGLPNEENKNAQFFTDAEIKEYISFVKANIKPKITKEIGKMLVQKYKKLRDDCFSTPANYRVTVRQLESLIRLSEALAKIHCDPFVKEQYVDEAFRLIASSIIEIKSDRINIKLDNQSIDTIETDEYIRVMNMIIYILKNEENLNEDGLIEKYLLSREEHIPNEEVFKREEDVCKSVVGHMLNKEGVLYEMDGTLQIHPNFDY